MAEITIQPSGKDTYLVQNTPDTTHGGLTTIAVRSFLNGVPAWNRRSILQFTIPEEVKLSTIVSAVLWLYADEIVAGTAGRTYWAYRLTRRDWIELEATWNIYKTGSNWTAGGGDYTEDDGASDTALANPGWMDWTVTAQVQHAADGEVDIAFLIRDGTEDGSNKATWFRSKEHATEATRPKLVITFIPALLVVTPSPVPTASSIQAPSVSGSGSSPITLSPVAAPLAVQAPSVSGSGSAPVLLSPVQAVSVVNGVVSGTGIASIYLGPIITTSSVMVPVTMMTCRAPELEREVAELELALEPKAHFEV